MKIDDLSIHRRATSVKRPEMTSEKEISRLKPEFHHMLGLKARNCVGTVTFRNAQRALLAKKKTAPEIAPGVTFSGIFSGMRFLFMWGVGETNLCHSLRNPLDL